MMSVFDGVSIVGGIARRGGKKIVTEGAEFAAEQFFKRSTLDILREAAEKELRDAGQTVTTLAVNRIVGRAAEDIVERQLLQEGYEILGRQVTARLPSGEIRYLDRLARSPEGSIVHFEVKSGGSPYRGYQEGWDARAVNGAVLGNNAPAGLQGRQINMTTKVRRVQ